MIKEDADHSLAVKEADYMKRIQHNIRTIIAISLLFLCFDLFTLVSARTVEYEEQYQSALSYEKDYVSHQGLDDWSVFTLSRADALTEQQKKDYLEDLKKLLEEKQGVLSRNRSTEYSRRVLAVTALGIDANDVYGYSLIEPLACYDFAVQQGLYGGVYTLLALDCGDYEIPTVPEGYRQTTRDNMISYLLSHQLSDGGWAVSGRYADPDATAIVISALTPYYGVKPEVTTALDKGVNKLSAMMSNTGTYLSYGAPNAESTAQVLVAMATFGIPLEYVDYVKEDNTILDGLFSFQLADGSFEHIKGGGSHQMATEQALYAMTALKRMQDGKASLYQMTDVIRDTSVSREKQNIDLDGLWKDFKEDTGIGEEQTQPGQDEEIGEGQTPPKQDGGTDIGEYQNPQIIPDINSVMNCQKELGEEILKTPAGWETPRKDKKRSRSNKKQKESDTKSSDTKSSGTTIMLDIKPVIKNTSRPSQKQQATKKKKKNAKTVKVKKKTLFLFPSIKQEEIALLVEQGVSFTVKKKGFSSPFLLEQKVSLEDGDYVLCQYIDANTKPEALAKVWVKKGILSITIKEPGHYFVGKRVRNCSVSELRMQQGELANEQSKEDMEEVQERSSVQQEATEEKADSIGQPKDKRKFKGAAQIRQYWWSALLLIVGLMIGCGWICRPGRKK